MPNKNLSELAYLEAEAREDYEQELRQAEAESEDTEEILFDIEISSTPIEPAFEDPLYPFTEEMVTR